MYVPLKNYILNDLEPQTIFHYITSMISEYQRTRSEIMAIYLSELFSILQHHEELCDCNHSSCELQKLSRTWRYLASNHSVLRGESHV